MPAQKNDTIPIDVERFKQEFHKKGITLSDASKSLGKSRCYFNAKVERGFVSKMDQIVIEHEFGIRPELYAAKKEKPMETVSTENTELIISYIQDLGKILGDIAREVREERTQTSGLLEKLYKEAHEISTCQKSETIEKRKVQGAINNAVQQVNNTTQAMLGVLRARK